MGLTDWLAQKQIRSFTKGICKTMMFSANAFENYSKKKGIKVKFYSDLAAKALSTRPGWKVVENNVFERKNGIKLKIEKDYSVADVSLLVVLFEIEEKLQPGKITNNTVKTVLDEYRKMFNLSEDKTKRIVDAWSYSRIRGYAWELA